MRLDSNVNVFFKYLKTKSPAVVSWAFSHWSFLHQAFNLYTSSSTAYPSAPAPDVFFLKTQLLRRLLCNTVQYHQSIVAPQGPPHEKLLLCSGVHGLLARV